MWSVYLACLVFGGALVAVSLFSGFDADVEASGDMDGLDGGDVEGLDLDADGVDGGDADVDVDGEAMGAHDHGLTAVVQFFSFRNIVFFLAFFGLTGSVLTLLGTSALTVALLAALVGFAAAWALDRSMAYLRHSESGRVSDEKEFEGMRARVLVGVGRSEAGKISVNTEEKLVTLLATIAADATRDRFEPGEQVIIVSVESGIAQVAGEEFVH